ncbi:hypothetical protein NN3_42530 [Nocardia neocaledoniensis NBRC 108232]|nr:hypothetical protein NN3_42530 [Nocardia neocaledoniensis NBRC 108232]
MPLFTNCRTVNWASSVAVSVGSCSPANLFTVPGSPETLTAALSLTAEIAFAVVVSNVRYWVPAVARPEPNAARVVTSCPWHDDRVLFNVSNDGATVASSPVVPAGIVKDDSIRDAFDEKFAPSSSRSSRNPARLPKWTEKSFTAAADGIGRN